MVLFGIENLLVKKIRIDNTPESLAVTLGVVSSFSWSGWKILILEVYWR
jgi:hypothetical protein